MKLTTFVDLPKMKIFSHSSKYMLMGSCFAENMGERFLAYGFQGINNPFGILFNPISIATSLERIIEKRFFHTDEFFLHNGLWHSDYHHGSFSNADREQMKNIINEKLEEAHNLLTQIDFLIITFGSSWVYKKEGRVVANCHKLPEKMFVKQRISSDEITERYVEILGNIFRLNSKIRIIFSVSPIRYLSDGAFDNSINKANLILAVDKLQRLFDKVIYFPSYEILIDELRDYRFYADDLLHPSSLAQEIVWRRFSNAFFDDKTVEALPKIERLNKMLNHNPINLHSTEYEKFIDKINQTKKDIEKILNVYI